MKHSVHSGNTLLSAVLEPDLLFVIRYANRAKNIKNHARINEDPKDAMIRNLENEIQRLRQQVEEGDGSSINAHHPLFTISLLQGGGGGEDEEGSGSDVSEIDENGQRVVRKRPLRVRQERKEEIEREIEVERRKLQDDTEKSQKERDKIARALSEKQDELRAMYVVCLSSKLVLSLIDYSRKEQDDLQQKLRQLERKLIVGGENLLDKADKQAVLLEESERELEARVQNEEQLKKQLQEKEVRSRRSKNSLTSILCLCTSRLKLWMSEKSMPRWKTKWPIWRESWMSSAKNIRMANEKYRTGSSSSKSSQYHSPF